MDHFVNLEPSRKFLFNDEVYVRLAYVVYSNFVDNGSQLSYDAYNAVKIKDGMPEFFANDTKVLPL